MLICRTLSAILAIIASIMRIGVGALIVRDCKNQEKAAGSYSPCQENTLLDYLAYAALTLAAVASTMMAFTRRETPDFSSKFRRNSDGKI